MNSIFIHPQHYSCAVDTFMEIATHLFLPYLASLSLRNRFTSLLFDACSNYSNAGESNPALINEARDLLWSYIIEHCRSFEARDCTACFSEIFEEKTFGYMSEEEQRLFSTQRIFHSFCNVCQNDVVLKSTILLTVVTQNGLNRQELLSNDWPLYVEHVHTQPGRLHCTRCSNTTDQPVLFNMTNSKFLFIEFSSPLMNTVDVKKTLQINEAHYVLKGLARNYNNHFTCAVDVNNKWTYFDDLSVTLQQFQSVESLRNVYRNGWCFCNLRNY